MLNSGTVNVVFGLLEGDLHSYSLLKWLQQFAHMVRHGSHIIFSYYLPYIWKNTENKMQNPSLVFTMCHKIASSYIHSAWLANFAKFALKSSFVPAICRLGWISFSCIDTK